MKHFVFALFISVIIFSCKKEKSFSPIPIISFKNFTSFGSDSANITIGFTDGDGDVGIFKSDTVSKDNLKILYLYKDASGAFVPYDATFGTQKFDTLFYSYRVPNITPDGQYKALEGDILIKLRGTPIYIPKHQVVKFVITLRDRAEHLSNSVSTTEITVKP